MKTGGSNSTDSLTPSSVATFTGTQEPQSGTNPEAISGLAGGHIRKGRTVAGDAPLVVRDDIRRTRVEI